MDRIIHYDDSLLTRRAGWFYDVGSFIDKNEGKEIIFAGDSMIARKDWNKFLEQNDIADAGIGGETSALLLERFDVLMEIKPRLVVIWVGINDFYRDSTPYILANNFLTLTQRLNQKGVKFLIFSVLHQNCSFYKPEDRCSINIAKIKNINDWLQRYGENYVNLNDFVAPNGVLLDTFTADGLNLNDSGYDFIKPLILKSINTAMN